MDLITLNKITNGFVPAASIMFCPEERIRGHDLKLSTIKAYFVGQFSSVIGWSIVGTPSRKKR